MALGHESRRGIVKGMMRQAPTKNLSIVVATPRMFAPNPSVRDSLASPMVAAATVGAGAERSLRIGDGYRQGGVGGGNGGRTPMEKSGGCQECGHRKNGWSQINPGPILGRATMYRAC